MKESNELILFDKYLNYSQVEEVVALFRANEICYEVTRINSFGGSRFNYLDDINNGFFKFEVYVLGKDYKRAKNILIDEEIELGNDFDENILADFDDGELEEIIDSTDSWSPFFQKLAKKELKKRYNETQLEEDINNVCSEKNDPNNEDIKSYAERVTTGIVNEKGKQAARVFVIAIFLLFLLLSLIKCSE